MTQLSMTHNAALGCRLMFKILGELALQVSIAGSYRVSHEAYLQSGSCSDPDTA